MVGEVAIAEDLHELLGVDFCLVLAYGEDELGVDHVAELSWKGQQSRGRHFRMSWLDFSETRSALWMSV